MSDVQTDIKKATGLSMEAIAALRMKIRGDIIQPGDPQYDTARKVNNGMIDKHPALIVRPVDVSDISSAIDFGCEHGLDIAVRGGGHNVPGFGTVEGGLVIDLSRMRGIRIDTEAKTVRVEGGAVLGDIDHATYPFNLAVPTGTVSATGVAGLTLGGGIGHLTRRYGLSIDNLLSVDMVLADGRFVTASREQNEDLFWAIRGGGGNFGIVTSFLFRGSPVATVYGGPMIWPMEDAADIFHYWQELMMTATEELNGIFAFLTVPPVAPFPEQHQLKKMCAIVWCYSGTQEKAEQVFKSIRDFRTPAIDMAGPIPFPALQSLFDVFYPAGLQWYWKAQFFKQYEDHTIELDIKNGKLLPTPLSFMHIFPVNGAVSKFGNQETAWGYRDANFMQVISGVDSDPANNERIIKWVKDFDKDVQPFSLGGGYVNMIMDEGQEGVKAAYGENYTRLAQSKAKYDPTNLFHVNHNILPKA